MLQIPSPNMTRKIAFLGFILGLCISNFDYFAQALPVKRKAGPKPKAEKKLKIGQTALWLPSMVVYKQLGNATSLNLDVSGYLYQPADEETAAMAEKSMSSLSKFTDKDSLAEIINTFKVQGVPGVEFSLPVAELGFQVLNSTATTVSLNATTDKNGFFKAKLSNLTIEGNVEEGLKNYFLSSNSSQIESKNGTWIFTREDGYSIISDIDVSLIIISYADIVLGYNQGDTRPQRYPAIHEYVCRHK